MFTHSIRGQSSLLSCNRCFTDYGLYSQNSNFLPVSAILHLYKILLTILSTACHLKFVFKDKLNSSCVYNNDPDTFVVNSRVGWKWAHKCMIFVTSVGAQYISTWSCVEITNQEKNFKIRQETIKWEVKMLSHETLSCVVKIKRQRSRREYMYVTKINWGELFNKFIHQICLLLCH